jgi:cytochrome b
VNATSASPADVHTGAPSAAAATAAAGASRRVLDAPTRVVHWLMALCFVGAYVTADGERFRMVHVTLGYTLVGLVGWRVLWGLAGPRQSRLAVWLGKLRGASSVVHAIKAGRMPLQAGQNVLQAAAVLGLLVAGVLVTATGYALFAEMAGGRWEDALEEVHEFLGNGMLALVLAHLGLVLAGSVLRRQNQALTMITGRVPGKGPDVARRNLLPVGALVLIAVISFWVWQWQSVA